MIDLFDRSDEHTLLVSVLAAVEVRSAVRRRQRVGDISGIDADSVIANLVQETGRIVEHPITAAAIAQATGLIDRHGLRALDSVQLASAMIARSGLPQTDSLTFVASDLKLLESAQREGLLVWNPEGGRP
jgi:uncharacterized protein